MTPAMLNALSEGRLPGLLGMEVVAASDGPTPQLTVRMPVGRQHTAPHDLLHGGAVLALADTACGYATLITLPKGAMNFVTVESKTNHLGTVGDGGQLECTARAHHLGRSTQVWDAEVTELGSGRRVALFRCTQMILYPRPRQERPA